MCLKIGLLVLAEIFFAANHIFPAGALGMICLLGTVVALELSAISQ